MSARRGDLGTEATAGHVHEEASVGATDVDLLRLPHHNVLKELGWLATLPWKHPDCQTTSAYEL